MTRIVLDGTKGTVELCGGVVFLRWARGLTIEGQDAAAAVTSVKTLSRGSRYPLLVDMAGMSSVTMTARRLFAASNVAPRIALLGESPVDRVMATFFLGRLRSPCPARFFTSIEEALRWLNSPQLAASGAGTMAFDEGGQGNGGATGF